MSLTTNNAYTQLLTLQQIKSISIDDLISQMNMLLLNPDAATNDAPQVADFNAKIVALKAQVDSLQTF
jgi:hypothetical protein